MSENQSPEEMNSEDAGRVDETQPEQAEETAAKQADDSPTEEPAAVADEASEEEAELDPLEAAQAQIADLENQLARSRADVYNVSQEYNAYVRRSKADGVAQKQDGIASVLDTLLSVLDDIDLARQHDDLEGPAGAIATKVENTLETNYDLVRFGAEGDPFNPEIHEALMNMPGDVEAEQIGTLIQPGYKMGDRVLRPARVGVVSPQ